MKVSNTFIYLFMAYVMKIPSLGIFISTVKIVDWKKSDGDVVKKDEIICVVESKKSTFELEAKTSGILRIKAKKGQTCNVQEPFCEIEESESLQISESFKKKREGVIQMKMPALGDNINKGIISEWYVVNTSIVKKDQPICELESDKATFELSAEQSGKINIIAKEKEIVYFDNVICEIEPA